jgi:PAS domain S-box-containing protein
MSPEFSSDAYRNQLRQKTQIALTTTRRQVKKMTLEEVQHFVQALQIQHVELEMQNEELRRTKLELETVRDRYASLFDFTPVGYVTLGEQGLVMEANLTFCHLLGVVRSHLLGQKFEQYVDPADQAAFRGYLDILKTTAGTRASDLLTLRHAHQNYLTTSHTSVTGHRVRLNGYLEKKESSNVGNSFRLVVEDAAGWELGQKQQKAMMEMVFRGVVDAVVTTDEDQRIVLFNQAAEQMFLCSASEALGQLLTRFIPERFREAHRRYHQEFGWDITSVRQMGVGREVFALRTDGEEFPAEITISKVEMNNRIIRQGAKFFNAVIRDITERKQAGQILAEKEKQLQAIFDHSPVAIWLKDLEGRYLKVNRHFEQRVGCNEQEIVGKTDAQLFARQRAEHVQVIDHHVFQMGQAVEFDDMAPDDLHIEHVHVFPLTTPEGKHYALCGMATDITQRKQAEMKAYGTSQLLEKQQQDLHSLAAQLLTAQEEERRRISRDLHDDINQRLALVSMQLSLAQKGLTDAHPVFFTLQELDESIGTISDDIRRMAHQYHPSVLTDLGLGSAIQSLCHDMDKLKKFAVICEVPEEKIHHCSQNVAICLYRIAQECLRNVTKHAQASEVHVVLKEDTQEIALSIRDNGRGFHVKESSTGMGFLSMKERVQLEGGIFLVESQPGQGTTVQVSIPKHPVIND